MLKALQPWSAAADVVCMEQVLVWSVMKHDCRAVTHCSQCSAGQQQQHTMQVCTLIFCHRL